LPGVTQCNEKLIRPGQLTGRRRAKNAVAWRILFKMLELLKDMWAFMHDRKKLWLAPILLVMLLLGGLIVLAQGSAIAPFIYTLF